MWRIIRADSKIIGDYLNKAVADYRANALWAISGIEHQVFFIPVGDTPETWNTTVETLQ